MKIEFPILWIDDNQEYFDTLSRDVEDHIESLGMIGKIIYKPPAASDIIDSISKINPYLVVIDYKLGGGIKGDQLIKTIRDNNLNHEILFYSEGGFNQATFRSFFKDVYSPLATGVNFCPKGELAIGKICTLIDLKLTQVADLPTQRGWIVADAIDLEHQLNSTIDALGAFTHELFQKSLLRLLDSPSADFGCRHRILQGGVNDLIKYYNATEPSNVNLSALKAIREILKDFRADIIELRNSIAHQAHDQDVSGQIIIRRRQNAGGPIIWSSETLREIRANIRKHQGNLEKLQDLFRSGRS